MAGVREKIKLVSTGKINGKKTGVYYTMTKNKRKNTEKMRVIKFDKRLRKHVEFKEEKIK